MLTIAAGVLGGTVLMPMKYVRGWRFEKLWLVYSICAYLISPIAVAFATVPDLGSVYADSGATTLVMTALFGFGWGLAVVLAGVSADLLGLSLSSAILYGASIAVGSVAALLIVNPGQLLTRYGLAVAILDAIMIGGVLLCVRAGNLREAMRAKTVAKESPKRSHRTGILVCFGASVLSTLFNVALAYGDGIVKNAVRHGADSFYAANAVWGLAVSAGSAPSILWSAWRLRRDAGPKPAGVPNPARNALLCVAMAILWISGTVLYGAATRTMGPMGPVVGWPVYMSGMILISNFWGWFTNEWKGITGRPVWTLAAGILVQIASITLLGRVH
jgi:L-rhamnose-H+ transport protein